MISTVAGTGAKGFSGDGGPGDKAQLRPAAQHFVRPRRDAVDLRHRQPADPAAASRHRNYRDLRRDGRGGGRRPKELRSTERRSRVRGRWRWLAMATCIWRCARATRSCASTRRPKRCIAWPAPGRRATAGDGGPALDATLGGPQGPGLRRRQNLYLAGYRESRHPADQSRRRELF